MRLLMAVALSLSAAPLTAQRPEGPPPERRVLEAELRRGFARVVRQRVGLSDEQMRQLAPITQRIGAERARIQREERAARMELGRILRDSVPADTTTVVRLMNTLLEVQKRRVQLMEQEHQELATIMTPVQRARFLGLQEQLRRQMEQRRRGR